VITRQCSVELAELHIALLDHVVLLRTSSSARLDLPQGASGTSNACVDPPIGRRILTKKAGQLGEVGFERCRAQQSPVSGRGRETYSIVP